MHFLIVVFLLFFSGSVLSKDIESSEDPDFTTQVKMAFQQINDWQRRTENILAQFALGSLPENFTPALFKESINSTVSLNLQRTAFRSAVYRRMMSSAGATLKVPIPRYVELSEAEAVERELQKNGFPAFIVERELFISKNTLLL